MLFFMLSKNMPVTRIMVDTVFFNILYRSFVLRVQDRAIRTEEYLRHYVLTHKLLDSKVMLRR